MQYLTMSAIVVTLCTALGLLICSLLGRIADSQNAQIKLPPETDWLLYPQVPAHIGWYWTRKKIGKIECEEFLWWNGAWRYAPNEAYACYFQECDFKGLTQEVTQ